MKKEKIEELVVKYVDHTLAGDEKKELDALIKEDPSLQVELEEFIAIKAAIQGEIPASVDPPYGDFFNHQLMRKIDLDQASQLPKATLRRWWQDLRWAWAPSVALALVLAFLAGQRMSPPDVDDGFAASRASQLPNIYSAQETLRTEIVSGRDGEVSAILVNGLEKLQDSREFSLIGDDGEFPVGYQKFEAAQFH